MRIIFLFIFTILLSCSNNYSEKKLIKFDINEDLTFDEFNNEFHEFLKLPIDEQILIIPKL